MVGVSGITSCRSSFVAPKRVVAPESLSFIFDKTLLFPPPRLLSANLNKADDLF